MDYLYAFLIYVSIFFLVVLLYYIYDKINDIVRPVKIFDTDKIEKNIAIYLEHLNTIDVEAFKNIYKTEIPKAIYNFILTAPLRDYYYGFFVSQGAEAKDDGWFVSNINPLCSQAINNKYSANLGYYEFAYTGNGDAYLIDPNFNNPEVFIFYHETGNRVHTGMVLEKFLSPSNIYVVVDDSYKSESYKESWLRENSMFIKAMGIIFIIFPMLAYTIKSIF